MGEREIAVRGRAGVDEREFAAEAGRELAGELAGVVRCHMGVCSVVVRIHETGFFTSEIIISSVNPVKS